MEKSSYTLIDNRIFDDNALSHSEFRVLSYLISKYNVNYGYSFPTRAQLEHDCNISNKTLSKVLNSLETNGYITRKKHKTKNGVNNIYYIHKYLVVKTLNQEPTSKDIKNKPTNISNDNKETTTEPIELTTNELLIKEKSNSKGKLTNVDKEKINSFDTELLIKAIERANSYKKTYAIGYLFGVYETIKSEVTNTSSSNNKKNTGANVKPVVTKFHNTFNEHHKNYTETELESKLHESKKTTLSYIDKIVSSVRNGEIQLENINIALRNEIANRLKN